MWLSPRQHTENPSIRGEEEGEEGRRQNCEEGGCLH